LSQAKFAYNNPVHSSTGFSCTQNEIDFVEKSNKKYKVSTDKKKREKLFKEENMMMVYLRRENLG